MGINARYVAGNLIFHEAGKPYRWIDGFGTTIRGFNFNGPHWPITTDNLTGCVTTLVEGGAGETTVAGAIAEVGGGLLITTDAAENDGANICMSGTGFQCVAGKPFYTGAKFKISSATESDFYFGLSVVTTGALGGVTDGVAFRKPDGSTTAVLVVEKNSTETTATALTVDTAYHIYEIVWDGTTIKFAIDGVFLTTPAQTNLPDDARLTPVLQYLTGTTAAITMTVEWWRAWQIA